MAKRKPYYNPNSRYSKADAVRKLKAENKSKYTYSEDGQFMTIETNVHHFDGSKELVRRVYPLKPEKKWNIHHRKNVIRKEHYEYINYLKELRANETPE